MSHHPTLSVVIPVSQRRGAVRTELFAGSTRRSMRLNTNPTKSSSSTMAAATVPPPLLLDQQNKRPDVTR